jgi:hypothetical protein
MNENPNGGVLRRADKQNSETLIAQLAPFTKLSSLAEALHEA